MHQRFCVGMRENGADFGNECPERGKHRFCLMCGKKVSTESKIIPGYCTCVDGLKDGHCNLAKSLFDLGPMTQTSVLSELNLRKFPAIQDLTSTISMTSTIDLV